MVYAEFNLTVPVRPANTRVMIALCVSCTLNPQPEVPSAEFDYSDWQMWTLVPYGTNQPVHDGSDGC